MYKTLRSLILLTLVGVYSSLFAQCPAGEVEVTIDISTDAYGYELYWELLPSGNACGSGTIFSGGNSNVGCNGAGAQAQVPGGYGNNTTITEGPWCLTANDVFDIFWADDYGDGGFEAEVFVDGVSIANFVGTTGSPAEVFTFTAAPPASRDMTVTDALIPMYTFESSNVLIQGTVKNLGTDPVTSFDLSYDINWGPPIIESIAGVNIAPGQTYEFEHSAIWNPGTAGATTVNVWASNINGMPDLVPANDILSTSVIVSSDIPNIIDQYLTSASTSVIANSNQDVVVPRDLDFHPEMSRNELWVINKETEAGGGTTVTFFDVGESGQTHVWKEDANNWHFMSLPTGIAIGDNGNWANSPGVFDANHNGPPPFTGPALWSTDLTIYAEPSGGNGSHLDMLHESPYSQGIAHEIANVYWVVDGFSSEVVRYDFVDDHGPGNSYHGDGRVLRYGEFTVTKDPGNHIVSHCVLEKNSGMLYVVDHGGQRVVRMDINTGTVGGSPTYQSGESLAQHEMVTGYTWDVIINSGLIEPAGIEVIDNRLLVSDHATGEIIIYDISDPASTPELGRIAATTPGIMGIKVGPDGRIWAVNATTNSLLRIETGTVGINDEVQDVINWNIVPNPANNLIYITGTKVAEMSTVQIVDAAGRLVANYSQSAVLQGIDVSALNAGSYVMRLLDSTGVPTQKQFIIAR
jgi:hypothetical protein